MKRVMTLYRVSTKGQVDKDDIPMQRIACEEFCERNGWIIVKEFSEKGISGFKVSSENRDAIQDIKKAALKKEFDILLVFMFDRLGRREDETPFVVEWFTKQGIEVWSTQEGEQRFDSHVDKLMNYIRYWQSAGESIKTSTRIKTRMEQLTKEGTYRGGNIPFGYKLVKKGRVNKKGSELLDIGIDPVEAEIVRTIFDKTIKDGYGSFRIASFLNKQGIVTHNGSKFQSNTVNRILKNKMYCGYLSSNGVQSPKMEHLIIIDENTFDEAQHIVKQRDVKNDERRVALTTRGGTLLSGNIFCAHCGNRLSVYKYADGHIRNDGSAYSLEYLKYICYHKTRKLCDCDGQSTYIAQRIDDSVTEVLNNIFHTIRSTPREKCVERKYRQQISNCVAKQKKFSTELEKLNKELNTLKGEVVKSLTGESKFTADILSEAIKNTQTKIDEISITLDSLKKEENDQQKAMGKIDYYYDQFLSWAEEFEGSTLERKKMIAASLLSKVMVGRGYEIQIELDMNYSQFYGQ